jgi:hypothetical protein
MCLAPRIPTLAPPDPPPTMQDASVRAARAQQRQRLTATAGFRGTMLSPELRSMAAAAPATSQARTLLGA